MLHQYKPGNRPAILDNPNLSEIAKIKPLPLDGVERNFTEALRYVHFPPAPAPATKHNITMPLNHIVHGQPPSKSSYAVQGAAPSFMMHPEHPLLPNNTYGATMPSNSVQSAAPSVMMDPNNVPGQPFLHSNAYGSVLPRYVQTTNSPATLATSYHVQEQHLHEVGTMLSHRFQEQLSQTAWQLQFDLLNTSVLHGIAPRKSLQEPTATSLLTGHQDYEPLPFDQAMPEAGTELSKSLCALFKAGNPSTAFEVDHPATISEADHTMMFKADHHATTTFGADHHATTTFKDDHHATSTTMFKAHNHATAMFGADDHATTTFAANDYATMFEADDHATGLSSRTDTDFANSSISSDDWTPDSLSWLGDTDFEDDLSFGEFFEE